MYILISILIIMYVSVSLYIIYNYGCITYYHVTPSPPIKSYVYINT